MISSELLKVLVCPQCRQGVVLNPEAMALDCPQDRLRFPIVDGIPVMLIEEAQHY
ncbi:MAG: Trm112 family protein [Candidatus Dormibacteraceae bacterium]